MTQAEVEPEFIQLFAEDALVKLRTMGERLLELETTGDSEALLATLCRDTHSLKGAAGMVGLDHVAAVAHALEDPLQQLRKGTINVSPALVDRLLAGIDGLRTMVERATSNDSGARSEAVAEELIARLGAESPAGGTSGPSPAFEPPKPAAIAAAPPAPSTSNGEPEHAAHAAHAPTAAATMQIAVQRLDQIDQLVSESAAAHLRVGVLLADDFQADPESLPQYRELARLLGLLQEVTMRARMVALATITPSLHRAVRDIAHMTGKRVRWEVSGEDTEIDRKVLENLLDPLVHLVRNSVDHGIETPEERAAAGKPAEAIVKLTGMQHGSEIVLAVSDDGRGIDVDKVRAAAQRAGIDTTTLTEAEVRNLIFRSGISTAPKVTEISGRGVGMDVVRSNLELVRGRIDVKTQPGKGTEFTITVPITLTIVECLAVESAGQSFAIPMQAVVYLLPSTIRVEKVAGHPMVMHGDTAVPLYALSDTLDLEGTDDGPVVVLRSGQAQLAFRVGRLLGHRDMVIKGLGTLLPRNDAVAGAAIEPDGTIVIVLDVEGIARRAQRTIPRTADREVESPVHKPSILVVDDALTVRELQRSILERAGYDVRLAMNGAEAMALLLKEHSDLVLTDVEMPQMDGFTLTERIRGHPTLAQTPVVMLTSHDSQTDRDRGMAAGANAYIIKSGFDQQSLLSLVEKLLLGGTV